MVSATDGTPSVTTTSRRRPCGTSPRRAPGRTRSETGGSTGGPPRPRPPRPAPPPPPPPGRVRGPPLPRPAVLRQRTVQRGPRVHRAGGLPDGRVPRGHGGGSPRGAPVSPPPPRPRMADEGRVPPRALHARRLLRLLASLLSFRPILGFQLLPPALPLVEPDV